MWPGSWSDKKGIKSALMYHINKSFRCYDLSVCLSPHVTDGLRILMAPRGIYHPRPDGSRLLWLQWTHCVFVCTGRVVVSDKVS